MKKLFEDIDRDFYGPADHNEEIYGYYQRSARSDISAIRDKLNEWFASYPEDERYEMGRRFIKDFDAAFYELFLYTTFKKLGFEIEIHPPLAYSNKRPDFLLSRDDYHIYAEAKVVHDKSSKEKARERKENEFFDQLDKIKCPGFLLSIHTLNFKTGRQPSTRKIVDYIEKEISKLNPDEIEAKLNESNNIRNIPSIELDNSDVHIIVKPIPIGKNAREKKMEQELEDSRAIGMYPIETLIGGGNDTLKSAVNEKAKRYGEMNIPYIICINALGSNGSMNWNASSAVWGSPAVIWSENPDNRNLESIRKRDGLFLTHKGARLKNVSGIFMTRVFPHTIPNPEHCLFQNPFADFPVEFPATSLTMQKIVDGKIDEIKGIRFSEILDINENWLEEPR